MSTGVRRCARVCAYSVRQSPPLTTTTAIATKATAAAEAAETAGASLLMLLTLLVVSPAQLQPWTGAATASVCVPDVGSVAGHVGEARRAHSPAAEHAEEGSTYSSLS